MVGSPTSYRAGTAKADHFDKFHQHADKYTSFVDITNDVLRDQCCCGILNDLQKGKVWVNIKPSNLTESIELNIFSLVIKSGNPTPPLMPGRKHYECSCIPNINLCFCPSNILRKGNNLLELDYDPPSCFRCVILDLCT